MLTGTVTDSAEAVRNDASVMAVNQRTLEAEP